MKKILVVILFLVANAHAQMPIEINFYGMQFLKPRQLLKIKHLGQVKANETNDSLKLRFLAIKGIKQVEVSKVCCQNGIPVLFIGLSPKKETRKQSEKFNVRDYRLSDSIQNAYKSYLSALQIAVKKQDAEDDLSNGYSMMKNPIVRGIQNSFIGFMKDSTLAITNAALYARDPETRAAAMAIIAYGKDKVDVLRIYKAGIEDPDATVRNNAIRGLAGIANYANDNPETRITVNYKHLLRLLHSVYWSDRDKVLFALMMLTAKRPAKLLRKLKPYQIALQEMANWNSPDHAIMAYFIIGRTKGLSDDKIYERWKIKMATD